MTTTEWTITLIAFLAVWAILATLAAIVIGKGIKRADARVMRCPNGHGPRTIIDYGPTGTLTGKPATYIQLECGCRVVID